MATKTGSLGSSATSLTYFKNAVSLGVTMTGGQYPTKIELSTLKSGGPYWINKNVGNNLNLELYVVSDNTWTNYKWLDTFALSKNDGKDWSHISWTLSAADGKKFMGKTLSFRLYDNPTNDGIDSCDYIALYGKVNVIVTYSNAYTAVTAGNLIKKTDLSQAATPDDATYIKYRTKFSAGTKCEASTFNSQVLGY